MFSFYTKEEAIDRAAEKLIYKLNLDAPKNMSKLKHEVEKKIAEQIAKSLMLQVQYDLNLTGFKFEIADAILKVKKEKLLNSLTDEEFNNIIKETITEGLKNE